MAGDTGQGQSATIFTNALPNIQSIEINNTGEILKETVADGVVTAALGTGWEFRINFIAPTTATHTLEGAIKAVLPARLTLRAARLSTRRPTAEAPGSQVFAVGRVHHLRPDHLD
jgi:hypothetical protein